MPLDAATQRVLKATKFPPEFEKRVDTKKVNLDVIKTWIAGKINEFLPEDDIVVDMVYNILETDQFPKIKELQVQLQGFLDAEGPKFCKELWNLMLSAQESPLGVPTAMLEAKKLELQQEKPLNSTAVKKSKCSIHSAVTNDPTVAPTGPSIVVPIGAVTVLSAVAAVEVSVVIVVIVVTVVTVVTVVIVVTAAVIVVHVATEGLRLPDEGALRHRVASEMYTCQRVVVAAVAPDVATGLANAVDLLRLDGLDHPFVAVAVLPLRAAQGAHHDDRGEAHPAALGLLLAAPAAPLRGHPHVGCRVPGPEALRVVDEVVLNPDHPIHGLLPQNLSERRTDADVLHLLKTLNHELM
ncbi:PWI domain-containing protein [Paraphaeosphaeria sporulosa]|uniref:PWI domain-containing protein n=1 Tax=Paraphaeosphaeria sporulosa TaxID=1460663 RepID=A0A177CPV8_9PLEO|nr:PWI domain-containing protein [Paraphaeosphaeria sporulosa]OAG08797.1 PWI domain-containing protein [Paraphaeosphaeria sporulosa]